MGLFGSILKGIFGGGGPRSREDDGIYLYVRLNRSGEVVRLRLDPRHDLAPEYKEGTYYSNKTIIGPESIERADATFYFDERRTFQSSDIRGGVLVEEEEFRRWKEQRKKDSGTEGHQGEPEGR